MYDFLHRTIQPFAHDDIKANFELYPSKKIWGLTKTDTNIDHRRVPNLMKFFERHGKKLPVTDFHKDYEIGDIVCWDLGGGVLHIGIIYSKSVDNTFLILHNIGRGQILEDCLFNWRIIGHYRYYGK